MNRRNSNSKRNSASLQLTMIVIVLFALGSLTLYTWSSVRAAEMVILTVQESEAEASIQSPTSGQDKTVLESPAPSDDAADDSPANMESSERGFFKNDGDPPTWTEKADHYDSENQTRFLVVASETWLKQREAEEELEEKLVDVVHDKIDDMFSEGAGKAIGVDLQYIRENLIVFHDDCLGDGIYCQRKLWTVPEGNRGMLDTEERDAWQCFAQVKLDPAFMNWAESQWENRLVISRTMQTGLIALATLVFLTLAFGYFTAEHKTRGFYSRRLQTVGLAVLAIAALVFWWLATQFAWL